MRRKVLCLTVALLCAAPASAQAPPRLAPAVLNAAPLQPEKLVTFDGQLAEVRWANGRWELHAGRVFLKDFGRSEYEAREAVRLIRSLRLTQYGSIGTPLPIMEYWLSDGRAPAGLGIGGSRLVQIDQGSLRVEEVQGQACLRDDRRLLFTFGSQKQEAERALEVVRRYGFSQVGYVGHPTPVMIYFLGGDSLTSLSSLTSRQSLSEGIPSIRFANAEQPGGTPAPPAGAVVPASYLQMQVMATAARQLAAPRTDQAGHVRFEPRQVQVRRDGDEWKLFHGNQPLAGFGRNQQLAFQALGLLQSYHFTEQCVVGQSPAAFSYFLVNGEAPRGLKLGVHSQAFRTDRVAARQVGGAWVVGDDQQTLLSFAGRGDEARQAAEAIRRHHFDHLCQVGYTPGESMTFFVRVR